MSNVVEIVVKTTDKTKDPLDKAEKRINRLGESTRRVGEFMAASFASTVITTGISKITEFVGGSVEAASALGESMNAVTKIFGSQSKVIMDWGKNNANAYGLSQRAFNEMSTPLGAMLKNSGMAMKDVSKNTIELTKRAADMASVFNTTVPEALEAIQAGLRGESDPLEKYGVGLSAAATEAEALSMTHKKLAKDLTTAELATARVNLIMKQTKTSAGDFTSTSDQLANSQRIAAAKTEELQAKIGTKLIPVTLYLTKAKLALAQVFADKLIPVLESVTKYFNEHPDKLRKLAMVVGGVLVAAFAAWTASALAAAAATIAATWPILLVVAGLAALAAGAVYAYTHFEGFKNVVDATWKILKEKVWPALKYVGGALKDTFVNNVKVAQIAFWAFMKVVSQVLSYIVKAAALSFGWIPGIGDKLKAADKAMSKFAASMNAHLNNIHDKTVNVRINVTEYGGRPGVGGGYHYLAHGGISGSAPVGRAEAGGIRSGRTIVGENGPEIIDLAPGSRVRSAPDTERERGYGASRDMTVHLVLDVEGNDSAFVDWLRGALRPRGGISALGS